MSVNRLKERIALLEKKIKEWDILAESNDNNRHNLSTSKRQDWVDELIELKQK